MNKQRGLIILIFLFLAAALFFLSRAKLNRDQAQDAAIKNSSAGVGKFSDSKKKLGEVNEGGSAAAGTGGATVSAATVGGASATTIELQSLKKMTDLLAQAVRPNAREAELLKVLSDAKQEPKVLNDNNPITGDMDIIRTQNPFPGTRYFHAQYMGEAKKEKFAQHVSFEFKPGPEALKQAIASIQASFQVGAPEQKHENFFEWKLAGGYCAWVSPLAEKDLKNHPFNAYTAEDKGAIRVAVEICEQEE